MPSRWLIRAFGIELALDTVFTALVGLAYLGLLGVESVAQALLILPHFAIALAVRTVLWSVAFVHLLRPVDRWSCLEGTEHDSDKALLQAAARSARFPSIFAVADALLWGLMFVVLTLLLVHVRPPGLALSRRLPEASALFASGLVLGSLAISLPLAVYLLAPVNGRIYLAARARGLALPVRGLSLVRRVVVVTFCLPLAATAWLASIHYLSDARRYLYEAELRAERMADHLSGAVERLGRRPSAASLQGLVEEHTRGLEFSFVAAPDGELIHERGAGELFAKSPALAAWLAASQAPRGSTSDPWSEEVVAYWRLDDGRVVGTIGSMSSPARSSLVFVLLFFAVPAIWAPVCAFFLASTVAAPLGRLAHAVRRIEKTGNVVDVPPIPVHCPDEVGELVEGTNEMVDRLAATALRNQRYQLELERKNSELAESERAQALVAHSSAVLAESFEYEGALDKLARLAVQNMADWCVVYSVEDGDTRAAVVAHSDPAKEKLLEVLRSPQRAVPPCVARALREGTPFVTVDVAHILLAEIAQSLGEVDVLRTLGAASALVVPLAARGRNLGCLVLVAAEPGRPYGANEVRMAEELARCCSIAIDNARLYRDAQAALRMRDEFVILASHELMTPLTPLRLRLVALQRTMRRGGLGAMKPEEIGKGLDIAIGQCDRLGKLIETLLDASAERQLGVQLQQVDLAALVRETVARFGDQAAAAGCQLELGGEAVVIGTWDPLRIEQVATNLIANAIKFGRGHPIEIAVEADQDTARLTVCDHGVGIPPADAARIFQRFGRAASTRNYGGFGLGLFITRRIVESHGGSIAVSSESGAGATFIVTLPIRPDHRAVA